MIQIYSLNRSFLLCFLCVSIQVSRAQTPLDTIKKYVSFLCDPQFLGRGYVDSGMSKTAQFIQSEFTEMGLKPFFNYQYKQSQIVEANIFSRKVKIKFDRTNLIAGRDFIIRPNSGSVHGKFIISPSQPLPGLPLKWISKRNRWNQEVLFDTASHLLWYESQKIDPSFSSIILNSKLWNDAVQAKKIEIDFDNDIQKFEIYNVAATKKGQSDSVIFFTAHYDHLGKLGNAIFPGASDNASGTAMILTLARYFSKQNPKYTMVFVAFAGEETGLLGSKFFVDQMKTSGYDFQKIKMVLNIDIMGNAEQGLTVVNTETHHQFLEELRAINQEKALGIPEIRSRGNTKNSDHYHFTTLNIPAVFMYSNGGGGYYHDIDDSPEHLNYINVEPVFYLLKHFAEK